ncbi:MAG: TauD/TfdA family dioxygenase [Aliidongia sp.]
MANDPRYNVYMDLRPGEMQFINNYHVLHGRSAYEDDVPAGIKRHLKRLWLATRLLKSRPAGLGAKIHAHWGKKPLGQPHRAAATGAGGLERSAPRPVSPARSLTLRPRVRGPRARMTSARAAGAPCNRELPPRTTNSISPSSGNPALGGTSTRSPWRRSRRDCAVMPEPASVAARKPLSVSLVQTTNQWRPARFSASMARFPVMARRRIEHERCRHVGIEIERAMRHPGQSFAPDRPAPDIAGATLREDQVERACVQSLVQRGGQADGQLDIDQGMGRHEAAQDLGQACQGKVLGDAEAYVAARLRLGKIRVPRAGWPRRCRARNRP